MHHDVGHLQVAQVEHAAQHVGIVTGDRALLGLQIDGAADLLARGENVGLVVGRGRRELQELAHDERDRHRDRIEDDDHRPHHRRDEKRDPVGIGECIGLGQHGREDDDEQRHDRRGVDDAHLSDEHDGEPRGERRRQNVDERVADQDRADHLLGLAQDFVDELGLGVAVLLERVHARARCRRQRGLAQVEEGGQRDERDDGSDDKGDLKSYGVTVAGMTGSLRLPVHFGPRAECA